MLVELAVPLLVIVFLLFPLGIALVGFAWGIRSYRCRYELENALAEARLEAASDRASAGAAARAGASGPVDGGEAGAEPDDLTRISGIGPVLGRRLNEAGIRSFAQIAAWQEADVEAFGELLSASGRIEKDDWIGQARKLAEGTS